MRWKLLLIVSLVAGLVGSVATLAIIIFLLGSNRRPSPGSVDFIAFFPLVFPLAMIIVASIFVYRHTARRRKLQALLTALLSALLMLTVFFFGQLLLSPKSPQQPLPTQPGKVVSQERSIREPCARPQAILSGERAQADLLLQRAQGIYHEAYVLVQFNA